MSVGTVLVLGGGPTGLATAYKLAEAGVPVQVIERLPWVGGLCKTFEHGQLRLDLGPHRFTPHTQEVLDFVRDLCGHELELVTERTKFFLFDRLISYPFKMPELLRAAPPWLPLHLGLTWVLDALVAKVRMLRGREAQNYEEWAYGRFGRGLTNLVLRPLAEKTWGLPLNQLSWRLARQRIAIASLWEIAMQILTGRRGKAFETSFFPQNTFYYPKHGYGTIPDRMSARIQEWGGSLTLSATVEQIVVRGNRIAEVVYTQDGQRRVTGGDYVVSTLPINLFGSMLQDDQRVDALEDVRRAASALRFRKLVLLYLLLDQQQVYDCGVVFFAGKQFPFGRTWQQKNFSSAMVPDGTCVLGVEVTCWEEDDLWQFDAQQVFDLVVPHLERVNLVRRSQVREYFTVRLGYVYPVWDVSYRDNLSKIRTYVAGVDNLLINGRPGYFFYNNLHHSLEMGFLAAKHILSGNGKTQWEEVTRSFDDYRLVE